MKKVLEYIKKNMQEMEKKAKLKAKTYKGILTLDKQYTVKKNLKKTNNCGNNNNIHSINNSLKKLGNLSVFELTQQIKHKKIEIYKNLGNMHNSNKFVYNNRY